MKDWASLKVALEARFFLGNIDLSAQKQSSSALRVAPRRHHPHLARCRSAALYLDIIFFLLVLHKQTQLLRHLGSHEVICSLII